MAQDADSRLNPFTNIYNSLDITDEAHTIEQDAYITNSSDVGRYGIRLNESPDIAETITIVENVTGGSTFTKVTADPAAGEFRVDPRTENNSGFCEFNSADDGTSVLVTYKGRGSTFLGGTVSTSIAGQNVTVADITYKDSIEQSVFVTGSPQLIFEQTAIEWNGIPILGHVVGEDIVVYRERLTGTLGSGTTFTVAHGISGTIATSNAIIAAGLLIKEAGTGGSNLYQSIGISFTSGPANVPHYFHIDDTNLVIEFKDAVDADDHEYYAYIDYKVDL